MATGDDTPIEMESFENPDCIKLIKDYVKECNQIENDTNWPLIGIEKKENGSIKTNGIDFKLESNDHSIEEPIPSSSSTPNKSYKDWIIGRYRKLENPIFAHHRLESDVELTTKTVKTARIMGSVQLGIHHSIGSLASKPERDLLMNDFMLIESTTFAAEGSNRTPAHNYSQFVFKTYAPTAFRYFRELFQIPAEDYLLSFCKHPLNELPNPGSSGSLFYVTNDDKFIIKTIQNKECDFLQKLLPGYYMNLHQNPKTLLPKFFGLYSYKCETRKIRLLAMNNVLPSKIKLHQTYDLKGSTYKRKVDKKTKKEQESPTYKDLDFIYHYHDGIYLRDEIYHEVIKTIERDCRVLESFKIMDYSLLLGIHILDKDEPLATSNCKETVEDIEMNIISNKNNTSINTTKNISNNINERIFAGKNNENTIMPPLQRGIPAKTNKGDKLLIFIGIIDILQSYRFVKKIEHTWKSILHNGDTISVHNPAFYSQRFRKFISDKVFKKIATTANIRNRIRS